MSSLATEQQHSQNESAQDNLPNLTVNQLVVEQNTSTVSEARSSKKTKLSTDIGEDQLSHRKDKYPRHLQLSEDTPSADLEAQRLINNTILSLEAVDQQSEEDSDIPFSDIESLSSDEKGDLVPHQRLTINNTTALIKAHRSIAIPRSGTIFSTHQSIDSSTPTNIPDVNDDLNRELAFYKQCLESVQEARTLLKKEGVPFTRPTDYFAEMVKTDEHMGQIKAKMVDEAANKLAAADARKQRDLKKFGKQVQVAKQQERDRAKRDTLDKIDLLKRSTSSTLFLFPYSFEIPSS